MLKNIGLVLLGLACIYTISHASGPNPDEQAWVEYCEMVAIYEQTGGESGWPDFNGNGSECK